MLFEKLYTSFNTVLCWLYLFQLNDVNESLCVQTRKSEQINAFAGRDKKPGGYIEQVVWSINRANYQLAQES